MKDKIVKVDPTEYGLDDQKVQTIEQAFAPKIAERDGLISIYEEIIKKEITPEVESEAKAVRLKLVKVRTGIAEIHKTQKAFFLAAGRFVDAWKNKETEPVVQMESALMEIEKHSENIEKERIAKLEEQRKAEVAQYSDVVPESLGMMLDSVYDNYLSGLKIAYEAKIKAEKEAEEARVEAERVEKLNTDRKFKTSHLIDYIDNYDSINFGVMPDDEFNELVQKAIAARTKKEAEIEAQRIENERLKKEAEEKERSAQLERERIERLHGEERRAAEEKARKEREEAEKRLAAERAERERIQKELDDKAEAERKAKLAEELAAKKAAAAPDKEKLIYSINSATFTKAECSTQKMQEVSDQIELKFNAFKKWALEQINTL